MKDDVLLTDGYKNALKNLKFKFSTKSDLVDRRQLYYGRSLVAVLFLFLISPGTFVKRNLDDWKILQETFMILTSWFLVCVKLVSFVFKKNQFFNLIQVVESLDNFGKKPL